MASLRIHLLILATLRLLGPSAVCAQTGVDDLLDDLLPRATDSSWVTEWKGFVELLPSRYLRDRGSEGKTDNQL
ncbi:MAG: hypothetical protein O7D97_02355, partial [Planctomycetota bacterium]|nr:hypothetical protein [Planctomycetota bacterium]